MSAVPLPAAICVESSEHVLTAGQPVNVIATGLGKVPDDGVTVTSYFADDPTAIVAGPELLIVKLNEITVREMVAFAVRTPEVPITVIDSGPVGVPALVAMVRKTSVAPLPAAIVVVSNEQAAPKGQPVTVSATGFGKVPVEGVTVMSYFPEDPAAIVAGPGLLIEKLKVLLCTTKEITVLAVCDPHVPVTVIV
jgi:hypothetical protein